MTRRTLPTQEILHKLLRYEDDIGKLFWRTRTEDMFNDGRGRYTKARICKIWNTQNADEEAFCTTDSSGYLCGVILGNQYFAHRIIWAMHNGEILEDEIDHIDHSKTNNRIENLRPVSPLENQKNRPMMKNNKSGITGVRWYKQRNKWLASIVVNGREKYLGIFSDINDAAYARKAAEIKSKFHVNHGN